MAYNVASIRSRVLTDKLDDPTFDSDVATRFINDAQKKIFATDVFPFMETLGLGNLTYGDTVYILPTDYQQLQGFVLTSPDNQERDITRYFMPFREFNRSYPDPEANDPGQITAWTIYGGLVYFSRPVDQNYTTNLYYVRTPTELVLDTDVPDVPQAFEELLVLGTFYRILERNEDHDQAAYYKNGDYKELLDEMLQRLGVRQTGKPMTIGQPHSLYSTRPRRH